jgi:hypothetical protein
MLIILALRRLRQEGCEFMERPCLKNKNKNTETNNATSIIT